MRKLILSVCLIGSLLALPGVTWSWHGGGGGWHGGGGGWHGGGGWGGRNWGRRGWDGRGWGGWGAYPIPIPYPVYYNSYDYPPPAYDRTCWVDGYGGQHCRVYYR